MAQIASALGLPAPRAQNTALAGWELRADLDEWLEGIESLDFQALLEPADPRGRSLRNLTVNVFHPVELLPGAFAEGRFRWDPDRDGEREASLDSPPSVTDYARAVIDRYTAFLVEAEAELRRSDPEIDTLRGRLRFSELVAAQRHHAGFHLEQLRAFLSDRRSAA